VLSGEAANTNITVFGFTITHDLCGENIILLSIKQQSIARLNI
jgi:hypothetical protein